MLPLSRKDLIPFTPDTYENTENAPVYWIAVATEAGKADFRRKVQQEGATYVSPAELFACLREGIAAVVEEAQQPEIMQIIDDVEAEPTESNTIQKRSIDRQIISAYPPYAQLVADHDYYWSIAPIIATRCFLKGIEQGMAYQSKNGQLTQECLEALPEYDVITIGAKAIALFSLSAEQRKNSDLPSLSPSAPETLVAAEQRRTAQGGK